MAPPTIDERVDTCLKHLDFSIRWKGPSLGNVEMRRHYSNYFKGFHAFKPYRTQLVTSNDNAEIVEILEYVREHYNRQDLAIV